MNELELEFEKTWTRVENLMTAYFSKTPPEINPDPEADHIMLNAFKSSLMKIHTAREIRAEKARRPYQMEFDFMLTVPRIPPPDRDWET